VRLRVEQTTTYRFVPPNQDWQRKICYHVPSCSVVKYGISGVTLRDPAWSCGIHKIRGDGNCFYRSISFCTTGSQESHEQIRQDLLFFEIMHRDKATALLWQNETFQAHIAKTATAGEDVTDVDVFCAAAYLGTTIYVYQKPGENGAWTWSRYGPEIQLLKQCQIPKGTHEDIVHLCCLNDEVDAHNYKLFEAAKSRVEFVTVPANERASQQWNGC